MTDLKALSLRQLRALDATVRTRSVTAAARELHVTPPAISTQLKLLEQMAGTAIFDRTRDGFVPTDVGLELLEVARSIEMTIGRARERIAALRSGAAGLVTFAAVSTAKYFAPAIVAAFQAEYPAIRVKLVIGNRSEIVRGLERNEYDLVLMGRPPEHVEVQREVLGDHPHILIAPSSHPCAELAEVEQSAVLGERFLGREPGSGTRLLMEAYFAKAAAGSRIDVVEMGTNETIKQAVMAGLGVAIISAHTCMTELHLGTLVALPLPGLPLIRQWFLIHRADRQLPNAARIMQDFVVRRRATLVPKLAV